LKVKNVIEQRDCKYHTILKQKELDDWLKDLDASELFAFDTETTSLNYIEAEIVGVSFAISPDSAAYIPLAHDYEGAPDQLDLGHVLQKLKPLLEDKTRHKLGHNH
jgi:DNA polymerase I